MRFQRANSFLSLSLAVAYALLLAACGSSKSGSGASDFASWSDLGGDGSNGKPIAYCNKASNDSLSYKIMAQYTGAGADPNWANLKIYSVPAGFESGSVHLQFWKGSAANDSALSFHNTPITFSIWDLNSGAYIKENLTSLSWSQISGLAAGASLSTFLSRVLLVLNLQDANKQFTVFNASAYLTSSNALQSSVSALLPAFYANPSDYALRSDGMARETVLRNMHPLRNQAGDFAALATALCQ